MDRHTHGLKPLPQSSWDTGILWTVVPRGLRAQATVPRLRPKQMGTRMLDDCDVTRRPRWDGTPWAGAESRVLQQQDGESLGESRDSAWLRAWPLAKMSGAFSRSELQQ